MLKVFAKLILKLIGWQVKSIKPEAKKFVLIGAPHTSNWDFPLVLLAFWTLDLNIKWVGKIQMFRGPLHYLFTAIGGIPVDRSASHGFIKQITDEFDRHEEMVLTIAPEGTRSNTPYWKSGFYYIARNANVPVCLGYINYQSRNLGFEKLIYPTGDIESDMKIIADYYQNMKGKHISNQGPVRVKKSQGQN